MDSESDASATVRRRANTHHPPIRVPSPRRPLLHASSGLDELSISRTATPEWPPALLNPSPLASPTISPPLFSEGEEGFNLRDGIQVRMEEELAPLALPAPITMPAASQPAALSPLRSASTGHVETLKQKLRYYVPILGWAPLYSWKNQFARDFVAGISVACLIIPQGLSFASALAGLPAVNGLYTVLGAGCVYTLMGTSRQLSVGPEALISMLVGQAISAFHSTMPVHDASVMNEAEITPVDPVLIAGILCFLVGLFDLMLGLLRLGFLDSLLSRALLRGFITAIALVIMTGQSISMLGLSTLAAEDGLAEDASAWEKLVFLTSHITDVHVATATLSIACVIFLFGAAWIKSFVTRKWRGYSWVEFIPEILLVVIFCTFASATYHWSEHYGIPVLGPMPASGWPSLTLPSFGLPTRRQFHDLVVTAALIAIIGFVESVIVAKQYAAKHGYYCSPNRELCALGTGNMLVGLMGGLPAFASIARSKINDRAGAQTQLAGACTMMCAAFTLLFLLPTFQYLPKPTLAAIIFVAAFGLLHETPHDVLFLWRCSAWWDLCMFAMTFLVTFVVGVELGTVVAVGMSLLWVVRHSTMPRLTILVCLRTCQAR